MQQNSKKQMKDEHYIRPQAAWDKMKAAQILRQTIYIYGYIGMGKTSFVADYLARRRYEAYSAGDTNPEDIRLGTITASENGEKERIVVVDDLHLVERPEKREIFWWKLIRNEGKC